MAFPPKRERHQQRNLGQLRRLKIHRPQVKPTSGSIELETDSRDEHEHQQNECEDKQREGDFFEPPIIHHRGGKTGHQTKPAPHQLHAEKARAALRHARAVEHYNPQRQQARYTDGQNVGGVSHDPICRKPKKIGRGNPRPISLPEITSPARARFHQYPPAGHFPGSLLAPARRWEVVARMAEWLPGNPRPLAGPRRAA